jgi:adenylate kinase family enzyme
MGQLNRDYIVIHYVLSKEKALERMLNRAKKEDRKDDTPAAMSERISIFQNETIPVLDNFKEL